MSQQKSAAAGNAALALVLVVLAIAFVAGAGFYLTQQTSLLASDYGHHTKHALVCAALAVVCLIGANFARPKA